MRLTTHDTRQTHGAQIEETATAKNGINLTI